MLHTSLCVYKNSCDLLHVCSRTMVFSRTLQLTPPAQGPTAPSKAHKHSAAGACHAHSQAVLPRASLPQAMEEHLVWLTKLATVAGPPAPATEVTATSVHPK